MKVILTHEVTGLGAPGEVVDVKDGYARNYLLPRNFATAWTKGGQKQVESIAAARKARAIHDLDDAKAVKGQLEAMTIRVKAKAGDSGRLFGAVTGAHVAEAVKEAGGPTVDKRKVEISGHPKTTGTYEATVRLHPEVAAKISFQVQPA